MSHSATDTITHDLGAPRARLAAGEFGSVDVAGLVAVIDSVAARASALDRNEADLRQDIAALADLGLFDVDRTPVSVAAAVIEAVATESLAVAFGAWAQRMTAAYLRHSADRSDAAARTYRAVADGGRPGVTGMAAAQRQVVGLGNVPISATKVDGGYRIDGPIAWASNVYPDSTIVLAANTEDGRSLVVAFDASAPGVEIRNAPDLLALNATASTMIGLDGVIVPDEQVLGEDLADFLSGVRPQFLVLQAAFCSGVAARALTEAEGRLEGLGAFYSDEHTDLAARHAHMHSELHRLGSAPHEASLKDLLLLRLDGAEIAPAATRLEAVLCGGMGYAQAAPANRRMREAAFLPVQSPSQSQLRWELDRLGVAP
ncbi:MULTISPECIES: acyl-CoA dehydrogenase family protein [Dietzia]|uniref:Alkylation response protein AidB-like acyl-CoA dehydrogenase n=1 Tax=Dietzia cinnamea TaxID=321318 RepID=A0A4R3ZVR0_9ACTN|nr:MULTISPECIES: acyl-CoA dehydrogenase family protein [Dietzia]MCT2263502.1 acyl-CoA/acyl-ACP dehydrogenase [Dietzia cinnamea]TCW24632.1 alkylation response protein AidB-like acyl-CoA dehydrogenase [Dietzia cinnamea]